MKHVSNVAAFFVFPGTVLIGHFIASKLLHLYILFPNLDIPFHYVGGLSIAYTSMQILSYLEKSKLSATSNKLVSLVFIFSLTATATVFWEFAEFIVDRSLDMNIQISLANTMQDQFMGILGGVTWLLIHFKKIGTLAEIRGVPKIEDK